jgi:hypothetical protein
MTCTTIFAQEGFKIGLQGGLPIIDFKDEVALSAGLDIGYMHALGEVVDAGVSTGLIYGFHETFHNDVVLRDLPDVQFIPIAASVRVWPSNSFSFGLEGGYALGINKGNDGGLYNRPIIGYLVSAAAEINFSYSTIDLESRSWNSLNFGVLFTFIP